MTLDQLKRRAKLMRRATGKTHTECLEQLAKEAGYANYAALVAATKGNP